jgi:polar amino acid transport system substrate-binding protein
VTVLGLGLLGLLSVQILQAYGCQVTAMDLDARKVNLAQQLGVSFATIDGDGLQQQVHAVTHGHGADAVLITAASKSREPVDLAIRLSRSRAKIVVVGTADIHPDRNELWQKEVELLVSRAAGPGSLDPLYELEGVDLPIAEVRWTQNRNLQEFLRLVSEERVQLDPLITHRISFSKAEQTYRRLMDGEMQDAVGVVLNYPEQTPIERHLRFPQQKTGPSGKNEVGVGVLGADCLEKRCCCRPLPKPLMQNCIPSLRLPESMQNIVQSDLDSSPVQRMKPPFGMRKRSMQWWHSRRITPMLGWLRKPLHTSAPSFWKNPSVSLPKNWMN